MSKAAWQIKIIGQNKEAIRFKIKAGTTFLTFEQVFSLWQTSENFRTFYLTILIDSEFEAYYWEHPALKLSLLEKPYECVLMNSPYLDKRQVNTTAFKTYFQIKNTIVDFDNLGKNARLIVPTPQDESNHYKHLARFMRSPQTGQKHDLFKQIGKLMLQNLLDNKVLWLNTAGAGVIWLHVRLDSRPKYYKTRNYKRVDYLK